MCYIQTGAPPTTPNSLQLPTIVTINSIPDASETLQLETPLNRIFDRSYHLTITRQSWIVAGLEPLQHPRWRFPQQQSTASSKRLTRRISTKTTQLKSLLKTCSYVFKSLKSFLRNVSRLNRITQQNIAVFSNQMYLFNQRVSFKYLRLKRFASINVVNIN